MDLEKIGRLWGGGYVLGRWLPVFGKRTARVCALGAAILVSLQSSCAQGDESGLSFAAPSTLDAYVPLHDLDLQGTVIDFLESSDIAGEKKKANKSPTKSQGETSRISPFRKWVAPQQRREAASGRVPSPPENKAAEVALRPRVQRRTSRAIPQTKTKQPEPQPAKVEDLPAEQEVQIPAPAAGRDDAAIRQKAAELPPLSRSQQNLRKKIRQVLAHYYKRPLNTRDRSPWEIMHCMLAYELHSKVLQGGPRGEPITAVGWLCFNQTCKRRSLMYVNDEDKLRVRVGPALQGHRGQLLAMLAQSKVSSEYPLRVEGQDFTVADLIRMEMDTCFPRTELTFKLIGLMHYLDTDATWMNERGREWNIPRLISEELRQPVRGAACGGTHRLAGLTLAYKTRERRGEPVDGAYLMAHKFVKRYQQYAYRLQNGDGSFSTEWFRGAGNEQSIDRKLKTTGHLLEWLLYAATEKELHSWRTTKAANYLASILYNNRSKDWEAGPLGHAIHALLLYDRMIFQDYDSLAAEPLAATPKRRASTTRQR